MLCNQCKKVVRDGAFFCPYCGIKLKDKANQMELEKSDETQISRPLKEAETAVAKEEIRERKEEGQFPEEAELAAAKTEIQKERAASQNPKEAELAAAKEEILEEKAASQSQKEAETTAEKKEAKSERVTKQISKETEIAASKEETQEKRAASQIPSEAETASEKEEAKSERVTKQIPKETEIAEAIEETGKEKTASQFPKEDNSGANQRENVRQSAEFTSMHDDSIQGRGGRSDFIKKLRQKGTSWKDTVFYNIGKKTGQDKKKKLLFVGIGAMVLAAIILFVSVLSTRGNGKWEFYGKNTIYSIFSDDGFKVIDVSRGTVVQEPDLSDISIKDFALDAATQMVLERVPGDLYVITDKEYTIVANDVVYAVLSVSGEGVAYVVSEEDNYRLYLYHVKKKKSELVAAGLNYYEHIVISTDGSSVAYVGENSRCYLYKNGKEQEETLKDAYPVALSSGGKYLYYTKNSNFYVTENIGDAQKLGSEPSSMIFNKDMTQLLYSYNSKTYFCKNGEKTEGVVSSKGQTELIVPANAQYNVYRSMNKKVYGIGNLSGMVCDINGALYYIDQYMEAQRIVNSYDECQISADGTSLLYSRGGRLYKVKNLEKSLEAEQFENISYVSSFFADAQLEKVYYENEEDELMYAKGNGKPSRIFDDTVRDWEIIDDKLYFIGDFSNGTGTLYVSDSGSRRKQICEVAGMDNIGGKIYYWLESGELYMLNGDKEVKVLDGME